MASKKPSFFAYVLSCAIWVYLILVTALAFIPVTLLWLTIGWNIDRSRKSLMWIMRQWSKASIGNPKYKVEIEGLEHLDRSRTYVIASNHQSYGDIFVLGYVPLPYVYLSKAEIFRIPFAGWGMAMVGCIPLRRGDKDSARKAMELALQRLHQRVCVLIFPEGTRSKDGTIGPFKDGAFRLALDADVPILPVAIEGSRDILPKGSYHFTNRAHIRIAVMPPIETTGRDVPALSAATREVIESKVMELRARAG